MHVIMTNSITTINSTGSILINGHSLIAASWSEENDAVINTPKKKKKKKTEEFFKFSYMSLYILNLII